MVSLLMPRLLGMVASVALLPVVATEDWLRHSGAALPSYLRDRGTLVAEQQALQAALHDQQEALAAARTLQDENASLRALLSATEEERIAAGVIGRPTALPYDVLLIDVGERDGVVAGAPVFVGERQVLGFVAAAFFDTAVVTLVTTPGVQSTVYIYGPDIYTTAEGVGGGTLRVSVPQGVPLAVGDRVVLPSVTAGLYGTVQVVESVATRPEQFGYVSPLVPLQQLRLVSVGREPLRTISFAEAEAVVAAVSADFLTIPVPEDQLIEGAATGTVMSTATLNGATTTEGETPLSTESPQP
jgi:cell shape-determining protein MreC